MIKISIIVPCYNEEEVIDLFYQEIKKVLVKLPVDYKIIFIDDGSIDNTLDKIKKLNDKNVSYISFSRNFGKEAAMYAGLEKSNGDYVVIIDVDLQHDPNNLLIMYDLVTKDGYDLVATRRINREGESKFRAMCANIFYRMINRFGNISIADGIQDYCMMKKQVVDAIIKMSEYNRFSKGIYGWIGFKRKILEVENRQRRAGESSWHLNSLFKYAIEGLTSFTTAPLKFATIMGLITAISSIIYLGYVLIKTLIFGEIVKGYPTLVILILFLGSIQLISLGIIGIYLSKTYLETKKRPIYIIRELNDGQDSK